MIPNIFHDLAVASSCMLFVVMVALWVIVAALFSISGAIRSLGEAIRQQGYRDDE